MRLLNHLNRAYRFVGHSLLWIVFGIAGAAIGFVVLPLVAQFSRDPTLRQRRTRAVIAACFRSFVGAACLLRLISCRVSGLEHYEPESSQLILANHPTLIDVVILISLFPQVDCVIKEAVTRNFFLRSSVRSANYISNFDPATLLVSCVERLTSGSSLLLFPEGTRSVPGAKLTFKPGAAEIALRAQASILPAVIDCRPPVLAKQEPWYRIPPSMPHFEIRILPPFRPEDLIPGDVGAKRARLLLNDSLQRLFETELA